MNWDQLIKIVSDSKTIATAVFFTSIIIVTGYEVDLSYIPKVSEPIYIGSFIFLVFSGSLLLIWFSNKTLTLLASLIRSLKRKMLIRYLSDTEKLILSEFRDVGTDVMNAGRILEKSTSLTIIELSEAVTALESKGVLRVANDRNYFWITKGSEKIVVRLLTAQNQ